MKTIAGLTPVRAMTGNVEIRSEDDGALGRLTVRFSPFGQWYEISSYWEGDFMERTLKGAFSKTISERKKRIKCLFDHGYDPTIGNKVLCATDDLREDDDSAVLEGDLFDTSYNRDLYPGLVAGVYGSSMRMQVIQESWNDEPGVSEHNPKGLPERTITEIKLFEAGPVTFPASPTATSGVRSITDRWIESLRTREPSVVSALEVRHTALITPDAPAVNTRNESRASTPGYDPRRRRELIYLGGTRESTGETEGTSH